MIEVTYPSGIKRWFHWINEKKQKGYFKKNGKIYAYPLPNNYSFQRKTA
jgi:hypothetical protein